VVGLALLGMGRPDGQAGRSVVIETLRGETRVLDLSRARTVEVQGVLGTTTIAIEDGEVRIVDSPCPHKLCVKKGPISRVGDFVACIPNGVVLAVSGVSDYDGITP
jgi:hypothetical protein